ncbi:MAG: hypothetical protein JSU58_00685 [Dehalococcoidales bacterium]|nr:MAG: hypothetical protein JSU58_00685 [Dehalococcoidales bacterium]
MICQNCSHSNPDENNYCGNCGSKLPENTGVTLKDLVDADILKAGDELKINLRGSEVTATLLADGKLKYEDRVYDGPLVCATAIRGQTCDSWYCWRAADHASDRSYPLGHYRAMLLRQRQNPTDSSNK